MFIFKELPLCDLENNITNFKRYLERTIQYFGDINVFPIKAEMFEQYIWAVLSICYGPENVIWNPGSHKRTVDIIIKAMDHDIKLALKSGKEKPSMDVITMSSYRLTSCVKRDDPEGSLERMLNTIYREYASVDYLLLISRYETNDYRRYQIYLIPSSFFRKSEFYNVQNWYYKRHRAFYDYYIKPCIAKEIGYNAKITGSMSYQLWYDINIRRIETYRLFDKPLYFYIDRIKYNLLNLLREILIFTKDQ